MGPDARQRVDLVRSLVAGVPRSSSGIWLDTNEYLGSDEVSRMNVETCKLVDDVVHEFWREGSHPLYLRSGDVRTDARWLCVVQVRAPRCLPNVRDLEMRPLVIPGGKKEKCID
jgi:hypothetical protein